MPAASSKQFFTVEEANRRLPLVRAIVEDIVQLYRDVHQRRQRLSEFRQAPADRGDPSLHDEEVDQMQHELERDIERLEGFVEELQELGVELKDPVAGLIDFRTLIDGREAYLCWRLGEEEVAFWHELDAGFAGRQPIFETLSTGLGFTGEDADDV
jgi:hypothetical protein